MPSCLIWFCVPETKEGDVLKKTEFALQQFGELFGAQGRGRPGDDDESYAGSGKSSHGSVTTRNRSVQVF
jgi:hypothetical protein